MTSLQGGECLKRSKQWGQAHPRALDEVAEAPRRGHQDVAAALHVAQLQV